MLMTPTPSAPSSYATSRNARFTNNNSNVITAAQRWKDTYNSYDANTRAYIDRLVQAAKAEFMRRNPHIKNWTQMDLAEAKEALLSSVMIDSTMQRQLDIFWVITLLNKFCSTKVVPIQIYLDADGNKLAWDGQHTLELLYLICTQVLELDPDSVTIPVNIYKSHLKSQMRDNFISLNSSDGKKSLDPIDIYEQQVFGVRIDGSSNPDWLASELKQQHVEQYDLFLTAPKFGDTHMPGAIGRINEINKMDPESVRWLMRYISNTTARSRPAAEKEMVMMGYFFDKCKHAKIAVDDAYIDELSAVNQRLFEADFDPNGLFWAKASTAYYNWHQTQITDVSPRFNKEPLHGMPFLLAQLRKDFTRPVPANTSNSSFTPATADLF